MNGEPPKKREQAAAAISDGTTVEWDREKLRNPELAAELEGLSSLERARDAESPLFLWGSLRVLEKVGEGGGGEVYRAYDPVLETDVALKLRKRGVPGLDPKRFLDEARRLARVRHPNVLAVRGADEHDGRVGLWTDFIRGRSLEEHLGQEGALSAREAAMIGLDLCRALAAVHAKGLVHRDVKTSNVMREQGGRILLMDFGSVEEVAPPGMGKGAAEMHGTPLVMAPEQLRGEPASPRSDIYALGVLLYRLVTCRYPVEASRVSELLDLHGRGARVSLRDRRPDLPLPFVRVVERALAADPAQRYGSAGAMERELSESVEGRAPIGAAPSTTVGWRRLALGAAALAGITAGLFLWPRLAPVSRSGGAGSRDRARPAPESSAPAPVPVPLEANASLFRRAGSAEQPLSPSGGSVGPGDRLFLDLRAQEPMYTYVLNEDEAGAVYVLFPIAGASPSNPLSPTVRYRLPGRMDDSLIYWTVTSAGGREAIVVIGSRSPLRELENVIARVPRASNRRAIRFGRVDPSALGRLRSIGGLVKEGAPVDTRRRLEEAVQALDERRKEQGDVWIWRASLKNPAP
jgi:serine/threonine-protein kinase